MVYPNSLPKFTDCNELASESNGGRILFATDDFFAPAENLLKDEEPVWREGLFTDFGKWMDGWETRRKRTSGHDWTIVALKTSSIIKGVCLDTCYFTGNYAPRFSLLAANFSIQGITDQSIYQRRERKMGTGASEKEFEIISQLKSENWTCLVPMTKLEPGYPETCKNYFSVFSKKRWTHLRLNIFPDGGVARLRVYGMTQTDWSMISGSSLIDLISMENGGVCTGCTDAHYGHPRNLIKPGRGLIMADGWETARRLDRPPVIETNSDGIVKMHGEEWATFKLGCIGRIQQIVIDTNHFKGNYPDNIRLESALMMSKGEKPKWTVILPTKKLKANTEHRYDLDMSERKRQASHVRVIIAPDGGFSRLRIWGHRDSYHSNEII